MQWDGSPNGGVSPAPADKLICPVIASGPFGYPAVNVDDQDRDPGSLLNWFGRLIRARRDCPEIGRGAGEVFDAGHPAVFGMRVRWDGRTVVTLHNLDDRPADVRLDPRDHGGGTLSAVFGSDGTVGAKVHLGGYGYSWFRVTGG
jgi:maltose alpha-D-glucosyltransferase/alpha-amylase